MGCRTANGYDINGFGQLKDGRGNICPVTIILPTIAMKAKELVDDIKAGKYRIQATIPAVDKHGNTEDFVLEANDGTLVPDIQDIFLGLLDKKIDEAKDMLIERFNYIASQSPASAKFMWENRTMEGYDPDQGIRSALVHGTLALGQLGLAECLQILIGKDHTTPEGMELAKHIEQLFKNRCAEFKEQYKLNIGVYFTPA
jgi:ribonucleoside-triphosphate reductase